MPSLSILLFCLGALGVGYLPHLPASVWVWLLAGLSFIFFYSSRRVTRPLRTALMLLGATVAGLSWGLWAGHGLLDNTLPESRGGEDFLARGVIVGLPQEDERRTRFWFQIEALKPLEGEPLERRPERVQVSWYGGPAVISGERWQLRLRLKPPRGFVNPNAFDYQLWLLRQGIDAAGYIRTDEANRRLERAKPGFGYWRQGLRRWLLETSKSERVDLLLALLIGDRSMIQPDQWRELQLTGTNHLVAISGLHVGFVALLGYFLGHSLGRLLNLFWHRLPSSLPGHLLASGLAFGYSALAGFSLPTQRALIMVLVVQWAALRGRNVRPRDALLVALLGVVLLDPLASFDLGFWLSFSAVAVLMFAFGGRRSAGRQWPGETLVRAQWAVFIGLMLPLAVLMHSGTLLAPVANLVAIPLVTFVVVPSLLSAAALRFVADWPSQMALSLADKSVELLARWLELLLFDWPWLTPVIALSPWALLMAALAVLLILLPRGVPGRWMGYPLLVLALVLPARLPARLSISFLDVGQGLAAVVQTPNHSLVYDAGPIYSERMEAGGAIVAPYLKSKSIRRLDALVVSHAHSDHAGGVEGLLDQIPAAQLWLGEQLPNLPKNVPSGDCHSVKPWQWDQVSFRFLTWPGQAEASGNNRSCLLLIQYAGEQILLTGDLEREGEWRLLGQGILAEAIDVLQVPHHGSRTSSTKALVDHLRPSYAVVSAGYSGRHGHPHAEVVARYREVNSEILKTGSDGAIVFFWDERGNLSVSRTRESERRYWFTD